MPSIAPLRRALARLAGRADQPASLPTPIAVELVEMAGIPDPLMELAIERKRERSDRHPKEDVMARYGYLLFLNTTR